MWQRAMMASGGESNTWLDTWISSTKYETKTVELPLDAVLVVSVATSIGGTYHSIWYRNSTSDSWNYSNKTYITKINGREVTFKNDHGGTVTYYMYAMSAD